jgi:transcriptional regulator with XRE-family HTH domain
VQELADRVGITNPTMRKIERGDPTVGLGVAFEAAVLLGVLLFHEDRSIQQRESRQVEERLARLPQSGRKRLDVEEAA